MAIDRVLLEVLRNYYQAIVEDMARIMERTAYTTFVKETADFSTGLVSIGGEYVAYPWKLGASSYLGLNIHSFIVAALGVLAAFQLVIFGVAAALYGVEAGKEPPRWLRWVISVRFRLTVGLLGLVLMLGAFAKLIQLTIQWAGNNVFTDTRGLVLTTSFLVLGLQVISAVLFISIFSGRLSKQLEEDAAAKSTAS